MTRTEFVAKMRASHQRFTDADAVEKKIGWIERGDVYHVYKVNGFHQLIVEVKGRFEWMWPQGGVFSSATLTDAEQDLARHLFEEN